MATSAPVFEDRNMSVGRVFQRAFSTITHNPAVVLGLALVVGAIPSVATQYLFIEFGLTAASDIESGSFSTSGFIFATLLTSLVTVIFAAIVQGALTRATWAENEGRHATFGECLGTGLRFVLPLVGVAILVTLGGFLGMILLIVPGVILFLMWSVATPAVVVDQGGAFAALKRSAELTKGARWKILALFLVIFVAYWLLALLLGVIGLDDAALAEDGSSLSATQVIGGILLATVFNAIWGTIQPSLYVELRQWKEGADLENLEQVFA